MCCRNTEKGLWEMNIPVRPRGQAQLCLLSDAVQHQSPTPQQKTRNLMAPQARFCINIQMKTPALVYDSLSSDTGFWTKPMTFLKILLSHTSHILKSSIISCRSCFTCLTYRPRLFYLPLKPTALTMGGNKLLLVRIVWKTQWWSRLSLAAGSIPTANFRSCSKVNNGSDRNLSGFQVFRGGASFWWSMNNMGRADIL